MGAADKVDKLGVVVYGDILFFCLSLAFVEFAGKLLQVHVGGIGPREEEISAEYSFFLVEDNGLGAKVRQHHLRCLLGKTKVVHL